MPHEVLSRPAPEKTGRTTMSTSTQTTPHRPAAARTAAPAPTDASDPTA
ncbi:hypothetical protein GN316_04865 [Xylophilus sp. Kf1]|nr:hypothetical protein [Xylophilus sp. Kf1]